MIVSMSLVVTCLGVSASGQDATQTQTVEIPANAVALEGLPAVRLDVTEASATRHVLGAGDAAKDQLAISVVDGKLLWKSRGNQPLRLETSGPFTYLSSEPGTYIRLRRVNDRIEYVEHVESAAESVTWWGELRVVIDK
jgi:hypothetical protein